MFCSLIDNRGEDGDDEPEKGFFGIELVGMTRCEQGYLDNTCLLYTSRCV